LLLQCSALGAAASRPRTLQQREMSWHCEIRIVHKLQQTCKPNRSWLLSCTRIYMHALLEYRNVHARVTSGSATVPTYGKVISYLNQPRPSCKPEASCLQLLSNCIKVQRLRQQFGGNFVDSDSTECSTTASGTTRLSARWARRASRLTGLLHQHPSIK
jgi:hypothetical protein